MGAQPGDLFHPAWIRCAVCSTLRPMEAMTFNQAQQSHECADPVWCAKAAAAKRDVKP
jgi:hypothetical protein